MGSRSYQMGSEVRTRGRRVDEVGSSPRNVVLDLYAAFDRGELGRFGPVDPDFRATVFGATVLDWPGFVAFGRSFLDAFSDGHHVLELVVAEGDTVATVGRYRGHHDGELMGVPATGAEVDFTVMHVDRLSDGRVVEHRGLGDVATMWAQLGVDPAARSA